MSHWFDRFSSSMGARTGRRGALKLIAAGFGLAALPEMLAPTPIARAQTVSYPAGWNLVAGPAGSTLVGADGSLYSFRPGDTAYEVFDVGAPLRACWGYWAYFPTGGSLAPAASQAVCSAATVSDAWVMVGNPSTTGPATVSGADQVLIYDPVNGYQQTTSVPVGAGAWLLGSGSALLSAPTPAVSVPAHVAPPTPAPTAAPYVPTAAPVTQPIVSPPSSGCCKVCSAGKPCGDSCIAQRDTCHHSGGCAC